MTDLKEYTNQVFKTTDGAESEPTTILWSMTFNIPTCTKCDHASETPIAGLHLACGPHFELDYDRSIDEASALFKKIYPNDEFLPRAPDPEEIIIGDEETAVDAVADDGVTQLPIDTKRLQEIIKENIADFVEQIENEEKCFADNYLNEEKVENV